ncbi:MAG: hypothetical protein ABI305_07665 [Tepidiformaceae bacterium]
MSTQQQSSKSGTQFAIRPGDTVLTRDQEELAHVKGTHGAYFELDLPQPGGTWLSTLHVESASDGRVVLTISRAEIDKHGLGAPGLDVLEFHDASDAGVISDEEALEERERMEHELAKQVAEMGLPPEDTMCAGTADPAIAHDTDDDIPRPSAASIDEARDKMRDDFRSGPGLV